MSNSLLTNYKSPYLVSLANDFDRKTKSREGFVLPNSTDNLQKSTDVSNDNLPKNDKKTNWGYLSGVAATITQVVGGLLMIPAAFMERGANKLTELKIKELPKNLSEENIKKETEKIIGEFGENSIERLGNWLNKKENYKTLAQKILKNGKNLHIKAKSFNHIGWVSLGFSYLVSIPSLVGASLTVKQPSMLIGTALWAAASPFMMMKKYEDSAKLKGFLMLGYALNYLGLANKIKNDNALKKGEKPIEYDFKGNKDNLLSKTFKTIKFSLKDHFSLSESVKNSFKQTKDYISGQRKEVPDFISVNPTPDNRKITSILLYAGGIPLMIFGNKNGAAKKAANLLIGTGLLLDAIGMFAIGRKEKGATKAVLLGGVPLRAVGDFAQTNKFMYGLRTLGGSSFEYYFAALNKEEEAKKPKADLKV